MVVERIFSSPGKLFLAGEYAVLWGGRAHLLASGPRGFAQVKSRDDRQVNLLTVAGRLTGTLTPLGVSWREPVTEPFRFVAHAVDLAARVARAEGPGFSIAFSPSSTIDGHKLGLGSSARATVLAAECARVALGQSFDTVKLALLAHFEAQGLNGSGGDVAACFAGGWAQYEQFECGSVLARARATSLATALTESRPVSLSLRPSPQFPMLYAFTGIEASTPRLVKSVEATLSSHQRASFVVQSNELGLQLAQALAARQFDTVKYAVEGLQSLLDALSAQRSERMTQMVRLATVLGGAAKQSGAGGGDGAVVLAPDQATATELAAGLTQRGFHCFPLVVESGLRSEAASGFDFGHWFDAVV